MKQTPAMAVGSAFDAFVKSHLHGWLYGGNDPKYNCKALFESQVSPENRDVCWEIGNYLFEQYKISGALADLMLELKGAVDDPKFEFEVRGQVSGYREGADRKLMGVPLLGKPDIKFINGEGAHCIFDWKVNGYYSASAVSPMKGYVECREQSELGYRNAGQHKDSYVCKWNGMNINFSHYLEDCSADWATQLATYGWLMGEDVGVESVAGIDQLVCNNKKKINGKPGLRIASHRSRVSSQFQFKVISEYIELWSILIEEPFYYFRDLSYEDSKMKCEMLDQKWKNMGNLSPDEQAVLEWSL